MDAAEVPVCKVTPVRSGQPTALRLAVPWRWAALPRLGLGRATVFEVAAVTLVVGTFSWVCFQQLSRPGLYGDEAWSAVHAAKFALGRPVIDPSRYHQVSLLGHTFPFMMNEYVGPVKSYVLAAAFAVFGVSEIVLRLTTSLIGLLGILIFYLLVRQEFGRLAAGMSALLLGTDLSYILAVRSDWGPFALATLARVASLWLLLGWYRARQRWWLLFLGSASLGLGLSHKFDFLALVVAVIIAGTLCYGRAARPRIEEIALAAAGFLAGAWPILLYNLLTRGQTLAAGGQLAATNVKVAFMPAPSEAWSFIQALPTDVFNRQNVLDTLLDGTAVANWLVGEHLELVTPLGPSPLPLALKFAPVLILLGIVAHRSWQWLRSVAFFATAYALTLVLIAATPIATGPHHALALYPLPHLFVGVALAGLCRGGAAVPAWLAWLGRGASAAGLAFIVVSSLLLARTFHERLALVGGDRYWSESIYELYDALRGPYQGQAVELLDWGFEQPLVILGRDEFQLDAAYWRILADENSVGWLARGLAAPKYVFVLRADEFTFDKRIGERFQAAYQSQPNLGIAERRFFQNNGKYAFSVFQFSSAEPPARR